MYHIVASFPRFYVLIKVLALHSTNLVFLQQTMSNKNATMETIDHEEVIPFPNFHDAARRLAIQSTTRTPDVLLDDDEQGMELVQALSTHVLPLLLLGDLPPKDLYEKILAAAKEVLRTTFGKLERRTPATDQWSHHVQTIATNAARSIIYSPHRRREPMKALITLAGRIPLMELDKVAAATQTEHERLMSGDDDSAHQGNDDIACFQRLTSRVSKHYMSPRVRDRTTQHDFKRLDFKH